MLWSEVSSLLWHCRIIQREDLCHCSRRREAPLVIVYDHFHCQPATRLRLIASYHSSSHSHKQKIHRHEVYNPLSRRVVAPRCSWFLLWGTSTTFCWCCEMVWFAIGGGRSDPIRSNPMRVCIVGCNDVVSSVYVISPLLSFIHSQESSAVSVPSRRLPINLATSLVSWIYIPSTTKASSSMPRRRTIREEMREERKRTMRWDGFTCFIPSTANVVPCVLTVLILCLDTFRIRTGMPRSPCTKIWVQYAVTMCYMYLILLLTF